MKKLQLLVVLVLVVMLWAAPANVLAQEAMPLTAGESASGQLDGSGDFVAYTFDLPAGEDAVVALEADHVVMPNTCVSIEGEDADCSNWGGGGGDSPISQAFVIPARDDADQQVVLRLHRPLDGAAQYTLTVYTMAAQEIDFGEIIAAQPAAAQPYHVYTLTADPTLPFTVEIEDAAANGAFLWAAYQPYIPDLVDISDERQPIPQDVDSALRENDGGIERLQLVYLGGDTFRVLVASSGRYSLYAASIPPQTLNAGDTLPVTVSYRVPLRVLRLNADAEQNITIDAEVADGTGALVLAYTLDHPYGESVLLGSGGRAGVPFPLANTLDAGQSGDDPLVVVQIPFEFTRDSVIVEVEWQPTSD